MSESMEKKEMENLISRLMAKVETFEANLFAFPLTNENLKIYVHELANIHLKAFNSFLVFEMKNPSQELDTTTMRKNYQFFNLLVASYYKMGIETRFPVGLALVFKKMIDSMQHLFDQQIQTAQFKEVTLNDVVDLKPIVDGLKGT